MLLVGRIISFGNHFNQHFSLSPFSLLFFFFYINCMYYYIWIIRLIEIAANTLKKLFSLLKHSVHTEKDSRERIDLFLPHAYYILYMIYIWYNMYNIKNILRDGCLKTLSPTKEFLKNEMFGHLIRFWEVGRAKNFSALSRISNIECIW